MNENLRAQIFMNTIIGNWILDIGNFIDMAHTHAAVKALRKSKKNREYNLLWRGQFKNLLKISRKNIALGKPDEAKKTVAQTIKVLDKAAQKKVIKKNTAARLKSRLMKRLNTALIKK